MVRNLFPLLLIAIVAVAVYAVRQSRHRGSAGPHSAPTLESQPPSVVTSPKTPARRSLSGSPDRAADLDRWVEAGLISDEQSSLITAYERQLLYPAAPAPGTAIVPAPSHRVPPIAEALGYLGGVLAITGLILLVAQRWQDMPTAGRLTLSGGGAAALLVGGAFVREKADPALARLRWFLWLTATASTALFVAVLTRDALDVERGWQIVAACSASVAVLSGVLWAWRERPVQQLTCIAGLAVFVGTLVGGFTDEGPGGLAVWALGAVLLVAGLREMTPAPLLTEGMAAVMVSVGALIPMASWHGFALVLAVVTGALLLAIGVVRGIAPSTVAEVIAGVVGAILSLQVIPATLVYFASDAGLITGLVTWVMGAALVYVAGRHLIRLPVLAEIFGGLAIIGGAALTGVQHHGFAPLFGIATAIGLVAVGIVPGRVLMSMLGSLGLLINVPWAIGWYFPGEGRAPLLILVCGALIIAVAVLLTRMGGRIRSELHRPWRGGSRHGAPPAGVAPTHP